MQSMEGHLYIDLISIIKNKKYNTLKTYNYKNIQQNNHYNTMIFFRHKYND